MKIRRYKKVWKHISFYVNNYHFRQPYQILLDGTFCFVALANKIDIEDNIPRYLQSEIKILTTTCAIIETEKLGKKVSGALIILKKFSVHKCGHEKHTISAAECLLSMVGKLNTSHYIIATQDVDLQKKLRQIPGVPLLYLHQKTPVLEQPSEVSLTHAKVTNTTLNVTEQEVIAKLKEEHGIIESSDKPKKRKRKGGPNPLSCKKKQKKSGVNNIIKKKEVLPQIEKKTRKKIRIPKHVKEELFKTIDKNKI